METVAVNPARIEPPRDRKQLRHARHLAMKRGIETGHLRQAGKALVKGFGEQDLLRQVLWIEGLELMLRLN